MKLRYLGLLLFSITVATAARAQSAADEVRATFEKFVAAQNAHDLKSVEALLSESPDLLWITRGQSVWGRSEALKRFAALYQGTWHLEPRTNEFRVILMSPDIAQIYVPITFTIGPAGQPAQETVFLMNQTLIHGGDGWRIASILPIPAAPAVPPTH